MQVSERERDNTTHGGMLVDIKTKLQGVTGERGNAGLLVDLHGGPIATLFRPKRSPLLLDLSDLLGVHHVTLFVSLSPHGKKCR